jgi:hypothetical protein
LGLACLIGLVALAILGLAPSEDKALVSQEREWSVQGNFRRIAVDRRLLVPGQDVPLLWVSDSARGSVQGEIASPPFPASRFLSVRVAGYPDQVGNALYWERVDTQERQEIRTLDRGVYSAWITCWLPPAWEGKPVRLVAKKGSPRKEDWLGVSNPHRRNWGYILRAQLTLLKIVPLYLAHLVLFLSPGLLPALVLVRRFAFPPGLTVISAITFSSLVGYVAFWLYFWSPSVGRYSSIAITLLALIGLSAALLKSPAVRAQLWAADVRGPVMLMALVGLFYLSFLYSADLGLIAEDQPRYRLIDYRIPVDNILPLEFAQRIHQGQDPRHLFGNWQSSDRPPLQAGMVLLQMPFTAVSDSPLAFHYELLACALQCSWIAGVWAFCRLAVMTAQQTTLVFGLLIFSSFFMVNSLFVWPKMVAGALALFAVGLFLLPLAEAPSANAGKSGKLRKISYAEIGVLGLAAGLAFLAHGSVFLTLLPLALGFLLPRFFPGIWRLLFGGAMFVAVLLPWQAYQRFYDPPGNRLVKWHIAGTRAVDARTAWRAIVDAYATTSLSQVVENKWENAKALFVENRQQLFGNPPEEKLKEEHFSLAGLRRREFHNLLYSLGLLNVGWIGLFHMRNRDPRMRSVCLAAVLLAAVSVVVWVLLMFGPGTTVVHQGSYGTVLLFAVSLAAGIAVLPRVIGLGLLTVQIGYLVWSWMVLNPANQYAFPNLSMILCTCVFLAMLLIVGWRAGGLVPGGPLRG